MPSSPPLEDPENFVVGDPPTTSTDGQSLAPRMTISASAGLSQFTSPISTPPASPARPVPTQPASPVPTLPATPVSTPGALDIGYYFDRGNACEGSMTVCRLCRYYISLLSSIG